MLSYSSISIAQNITESQTPTEQGSTDPVNQSLRAARDRVFNLDGFPPLSAEKPGAPPRVTLRNKTPLPELPVKESDVVILAKVSAARSHLLPKEAGIYTEYRATASRVISNRTTWNGSDLAIIHPGGAIQTATGRILRHLLMGEGAPIEVGGDYLMFLKYSAAAECFQFVKVWQVIAGTLRPNAIEDTVRATRGESQVEGKTQESVLNTLARQQ